MPNECKTLIRFNSLIVLFKYTSKSKRSSFEIILCLLRIYQQSIRLSYKYAVNSSFGVYFVSTCLSVYSLNLILHLIKPLKLTFVQHPSCAHRLPVRCIHFLQQLSSKKPNKPVETKIGKGGL